MASGMVNPSFKAFDYASNDVLCSYDDFSQKNGTIKMISNPESGKDFSKDFQRSRMTRCSSGIVYNQPDDVLCQATLSLVEKCMKRHSEDIMQVLQGISSRLSHLELYCYNIDKSVGEIHLNLRRDYEETDARLASLDKHLEDVSRSVQILSENQKMLAKLQLGQKESSSPNASASPSSNHYKTDDTFEIQNQDLTIVLHQQEPPTQQLSPTRPVEVLQTQVAPQLSTQHQHYYITSVPYQVQVQVSQDQHFTSGTHYHTPQFLQPEINHVQFQQVPAQVSQASPQVHFIQHQQQTQQPQQMMSAQVSAQQPPKSALIRPQTASGYLPHGPNSLNVGREAAPNVNAMSNGYSRGAVQQLQFPCSRGAFGEIYKSDGPHHSLSPAYVNAYMMYGNDEVTRQLPATVPANR